MCVSLLSPPLTPPILWAEQQNPPPTPLHDPIAPVPASVPASNCATYAWEELSFEKCLNIAPPNLRKGKALQGITREIRDLECRKWGFKRWGFKEIRGYLRKKAFFLRFLDFPGALGTLRKRAKKGRKRAILADFGRFPGRAARHPLSPHLLHPHLRQPK